MPGETNHPMSAHPDLYRLLPDTPTPHRLEPDYRLLGTGNPDVYKCGRCGASVQTFTLLANCPVQRLTIAEKALVRKLKCVLTHQPTVADYNAEALRLNDRMLDAWLIQHTIR